MAKYTVVIKNRFLDEQTVARVKTFDDEKEFYTLGAEEAALTQAYTLNELVDNDIYFYDVDEEDADEDTILKIYKQLKVEGKTNEEIIDYLEYCDTGATSHEEFDLWIHGKN